MKKINISLERIIIFMLTEPATAKIFTKLQTFKKVVFTNSSTFLSTYSFLTPFWFSSSPLTPGVFLEFSLFPYGSIQ